MEVIKQSLRENSTIDQYVSYRHNGLDPYFIAPGNHANGSGFGSFVERIKASANRIYNFFESPPLEPVERFNDLRHETMREEGSIGKVRRMHLIEKSRMEDQLLRSIPKKAQSYFNDRRYEAMQEGGAVYKMRLEFLSIKGKIGDAFNKEQAIPSVVYPHFNDRQFETLREGGLEYRNRISFLSEQAKAIPATSVIWSDLRFEVKRNYDNFDIIENAAQSVIADARNLKNDIINKFSNKAANKSISSESPLMDDQIDYTKMVEKKRGSAYSPDVIVQHSHIHDPIITINDRPAGNSRIWGDAPPETQIAAIRALVNAANQQGLDLKTKALILAIAHTESGFNPDAAAGTTSAVGLGQFVDGTGRAYNLNDNNRYDLNSQASALVKHTMDNIGLATKRGQGFEYVYKYHHDGPTSEYGGLSISVTKVMPLTSKFLNILQGEN